MRPVIYTSRVGNLANQMIQYMAALRIAADLENCQIADVNLPEWKIAFPPEHVDPERTLQVHSIMNGVRTNDITRLGLSDLIKSGQYDNLGIFTYAQHMANFLSPDFYREVFQSGLDVEGFGSDKIVINIRGNEILSGIHPEYVLLPIEYYQDIVKSTGLKPVFLGQIDDSPYMRRLMAEFPAAEYRSTQGALIDFETLRRSSHIVVAISTFSWLAAWLSHADSVYLPLSGLFNPFQYPAINLLPLNDKRYHFDLFPINYAVPVVRYQQIHTSLRAQWRRMSAEMMQQLLRDYPRYGYDQSKMFSHFDENYYLSSNLDVRQAVEAGTFQSGRQHFEKTGHLEGRGAFPLDPEWYCLNYTMAALEVGQGDYLNLHSHYLEIGRSRGYKNVPPELK